MSETETPADVMETATKLAADNCGSDASFCVGAFARAILADRKRLADSVDLALLDFSENDPVDWARGHAHAKNVVMKILRGATP